MPSFSPLQEVHGEEARILWGKKSVSISVQDSTLFQGYVDQQYDKSWLCGKKTVGSVKGGKQGRWIVWTAVNHGLLWGCY